MKHPNLTPPPHLTGAALEFWERVQRDFAIADEAGLRLLTMAAEALATAELARQALQQYGLTFVDRWGQPRSRPEVQTQRASMVTFSRLIRALNIDLPTGDAADG